MSWSWDNVQFGLAVAGIGWIGTMVVVTIIDWRSVWLDPLWSITRRSRKEVMPDDAGL